MRLQFPINVGDLVRVSDTVESFGGSLGTLVDTSGGGMGVVEFDLLSKHRRSVKMVDLTRIDRVQPYRDAIFAVDPGACNLSGVARSLGRALDVIWWEAKRVKGGGGTEYVNKHPAITLLLSQMIYLNTGDCIDTDAYVKALDACKAKVAEADAAKQQEQPCTA